MKFLLHLLSFVVVFQLGLSKSYAQTSSSFNDTVLKIKEDDDGKLIVLKSEPQILYLKYSNTNFESVLSKLKKSASQNLPVKISTDDKLNILNAE